MPVDQKRLAQILGLLGSAHDGEALSAARKAHSMVMQAKLTWDEVLKGGGYTKDYVQEVANRAYQEGLKDGKPAPALTFAALAKTLLRDYGDELTTWETTFLLSWQTKHYRPSPKQMDVFDRLAERFGMALPP